MLDVHPPEHAAHSWRDFFIHIATIVVGLLIAIGLEQSVEWIHHREQVRESRQRIREELEADRTAIETNMARLRQDDARLVVDGALLSQAGSSSVAMTQLHYSWDLLLEPNSAWEVVHQTQALSLMPPWENEKYAYFYRLLAEDYAVSVAYIAETDNAEAIAERVASEEKPSAIDTQRLQAITDELRGKIANQLQLYVFLDNALKDWLSNH
jgi:hypothetical protein